MYTVLITIYAVNGETRQQYHETINDQNRLADYVTDLFDLVRTFCTVCQSGRVDTLRTDGKFIAFFEEMSIISGESEFVRNAFFDEALL